MQKHRGLGEQRYEAVLLALRASGARRVLDLGCGEGRLLLLLLADNSFHEIVGLDHSPGVLELARTRLRYHAMTEPQRRRLRLLRGTLTQPQPALSGYDAAAVVEVIEHLNPAELAAFEDTVFRHARPRTVVLTTPNVEYNVRYETLPIGQFRHEDHLFEWSRAEFQTWARRVCATSGYTAEFRLIGTEDPDFGSPTQMGIFTRARAG